MKNVKVSWLVNNMIADFNKVIFIKTEKITHKSIVLCKWQDDYYKQHKEELYNYEINFISLDDDTLKIFIKEVKDNGKN